LIRKMRVIFVFGTPLGYTTMLKRLERCLAKSQNAQGVYLVLDVFYCLIDEDDDNAISKKPAVESAEASAERGENSFHVPLPFSSTSS
jgi:hypothetical protein